MLKNLFFSLLIIATSSRAGCPDVGSELDWRKESVFGIPVTVHQLFKEHNGRIDLSDMPIDMEESVGVVVTKPHMNIVVGRNAENPGVNNPDGLNQELHGWPIFHKLRIETRDRFTKSVGTGMFIQIVNPPPKLVANLRESIDKHKDAINVTCPFAVCRVLRGAGVNIPLSIFPAEVVRFLVDGRMNFEGSKLQVRIFQTVPGPLRKYLDELRSGPPRVVYEDGILPALRFLRYKWLSYYTMIFTRPKPDSPGETEDVIGVEFLQQDMDGPNLEPGY